MKKKMSDKERLAKMIKATAPPCHRPTAVHKPSKPSLVEKAIRKASREDA